MPSLNIVAGYWNFDTIGVRSYQGNGTWDDISLNLPADWAGWHLWDLQFVGSKLYALLKYGGSWGYKSALLRFDGTVWTTVVGTGSLNSAMVDEQPMSCLFCWNGQTYVAGDGRLDTPQLPSSNSDFVFHLYQLVNETLVEVDADHAGDLGIYVARRTCVLPMSRTDLLVGDLDHDSWGLYHATTHSFAQSSDYAGSCVFALGVDNDGMVWSGDYGRFFFYSRDNGQSFVKPDEFWLYGNSELPEVWEFYHWGGNFIGVGCNPCNIAVRNSNAIVDGSSASIAGGWDIVCRLADFFPDYERHRDGQGFICCEADGSSLMVGFGGEPWYYFNQQTGRVFLWNGATLTDVGGGLDWGNGVHILTSPHRQCAGGILNGSHFDAGVRLDPSTDPRRRGLAGASSSFSGQLI